jgi:hypothetical protein
MLATLPVVLHRHRHLCAVARRTYRLVDVRQIQPQSEMNTWKPPTSAQVASFMRTSCRAQTLAFFRRLRQPAPDPSPKRLDLADAHLVNFGQAVLMHFTQKKSHRMIPLSTDKNSFCRLTIQSMSNEGNGAWFFKIKLFGILTSIWTETRLIEKSLLTAG